VPLRLAIFDCDGTLADSEASIVDAVRAAFAGQELPAPARDQIVGSIGLSLDSFLDEVAPGLDDAERSHLLDSYRSNFSRLREERGADPLFEGIARLLDDLTGSGILLGVATGKSRRGLLRFLEAHRLTHRFATLQTADDAPSKPHPGMIERALAETGTEPGDAVMIGDTTFDITAGVNAGVRSIGVDWGHHDGATLLSAGAACVVTDADALGRILLGD
jgi:phosphoglycolate phosphatase